MAQDVMTAQQAAEFLQTSRDTVIRKARAGELPAAKLGREWRFRRADLDRWLRRGGDRYEKQVEEGMALEMRERMAEDDGKRTTLDELLAEYGHAA
jgi:excisionase family DNA binding protein